jgi:hypothetical protein
VSTAFPARTIFVDLEIVIVLGDPGDVERLGEVHGPERLHVQRDILPFALGEHLLVVLDRIVPAGVLDRVDVARRADDVAQHAGEIAAAGVEFADRHSALDA